MQLTAKLIQLLPLQTGTGKNGQWKKQEFIVETEGQFSKKVCISIWGDKINDSQLQVGNDLRIDFDIESREYNGRWYTDVKAWKIELASSSSSVAGGGQNMPGSPADTGFEAINTEDDGLPF
jgi:hypothetical protein